MRKFVLTFLAGAIFGWLLALAAPPAMAYYPPLTATATFTYNSVSRTVYDPKLKKNQELTTQWGGQDVQVMDLKQQNGVISWIFRNGATFFVYYSVYDPYLAEFKEDMQGPFTSVSQLQIQDGVLAYIADIPPSGGDPGHSEFRYATYDPALQSWQKHYEYVTGMQPQSVVTKDGVVLMQYIFYGSYWFTIEMYDPVLGAWWWGTGLDNKAGFTYLAINNASVDFAFWDTGVLISGTFGCKMGALGNGWHWGITTPPQAYFVAQPTSGPAPLWVWFTDMSIAGTTWNWYFGDSGSSTSRSPYHTYSNKGSYWVGQSVNNASSIFARNIDVKAPVMMGPLLLLLLQ
jgi:hypothetical protein